MDPTQQITLDMATVTLLMSYLTSLLIVPLVELLPGITKPAQKPAHDWLIRLLGYAGNFLLLCAMLASQGMLDWRNWYVYLGAAFGQSVAAHVGYTLHTSVAARAANQQQTSQAVPSVDVALAAAQQALAAASALSSSTPPPAATA